MAVGAASVSVLLQGLSERVAAAAPGGSEGLQLVPGINRDMENLSTTILAILPLVEDAEMQLYLPYNLAAWLRQLMDAAHVADGILNRLGLQANKEGSAHGGRVKYRYLSCIFHSCSTRLESHCFDVPKMASEMKAIVKRLYLLAGERDELLVELLRSRKRMLSSEHFGAFLQARSRRPTTTKFKRISVTHHGGYWLKELNDVEELVISSLNNVSSGEEAARSRLIKRRHLETLKLAWEWELDCNGRPRGLDDEVLENLQPHPNLKKLIIENHYGSKFPDWMENQWLSKLETIELKSCLTWLFTPLGKLPFLKYLYIKGLYIPSYPLEEQQLHRTEGWEGSEGDDDSQLLFPALRVLRISYCLNLTRLPLLPLTLTVLYIHHMINLRAIPGLWGCDGGEMQGENESSSPSSCCITSLREGPLQPRLGALEILTIDDCPRLESFPVNGLRLLVSLKSFTIKDCGKLTWSPEHGSCLPASLVDLEIIRCPGIYVDSFFMGMINLTSLVSLQIEGGEPCNQIEGGDLNERTEGPELHSLPGELLCHLTALKELEIRNCPELQMLGFQALASLRRLKIDACENLHSPPSFECWGPPPLESLRMKRVHLQFLTPELLQNLTSLKRLNIEICLTHDQSLPDGLESLTKLEELYITSCPDLMFLPEKGLPASLNKLIITECSLLVERCKEGGQHWPMIANIPHVEIDDCQIETEAWKRSTLQGA